MIPQYDKIEVKGQTVIIDSNNMNFTEATIGEYLQKEGGYYSYFGSQFAHAEDELANAESELTNAKDELEYVHDTCFKEFKDKKASDKLADASANIDPEVVAVKKKVNECKKKVNECKLKVSLLKRHLMAWDRTHDNAQNVGHTLRKEMDKLNNDIPKTTSSFNERLVDELVEHVDLEDFK